MGFPYPVPLTYIGNNAGTFPSSYGEPGLYTEGYEYFLVHNMELNPTTGLLEIIDDTQISYYMYAYLKVNEPFAVDPTGTGTGTGTGVFEGCSSFLDYSYRDPTPVLFDVEFSGQGGNVGNLGNMSLYPDPVFLLFPPAAFVSAVNGLGDVYLFLSDGVVDSLPPDCITWILCDPGTASGGFFAIVWPDVLQVTVTGPGALVDGNDVRGTYSLSYSGGFWSGYFTATGTGDPYHIAFCPLLQPGVGIFNLNGGSGLSGDSGGFSSCNPIDTDITLGAGFLARVFE
jgi:hypothetical protein